LAFEPALFDAALFEGYWLRKETFVVGGGPS
jgi:hypothetical protein